MEQRARTWVSRSLMVLAAASPTLHSAESSARDISFELQAYPTGVISGIRFDYAFDNRQPLPLRLGVGEGFIYWAGVMLGVRLGC